MTLTPEQVRDLAQMSPAMWDMLRSVKLGDHALRPPSGVPSGPAKKEPRSWAGLRIRGFQLQ
jgi:hypothetical protein